MAAPRAVVVFTFGGSVTVQSLAATDPGPTALELDAIATAWTPRAGGVRPAVRIIESMPSMRSSGLGSSGPAGSLPT